MTLDRQIKEATAEYRTDIREGKTTRGDALKGLMTRFRLTYSRAERALNQR